MAAEDDKDKAKEGVGEQEPATPTEPIDEEQDAASPDAGDAGTDRSEAEEEEEEEEEEEPLDLDARTLCSDGNCIGVIGSDGHCKECGEPLDPADRRAKTMSASTSAAAIDEEQGEQGDSAEDDEEAPPAAKAPKKERPASKDYAEVDFSSRVLCSDGACIGIIGMDGQCKECGKPYTGDADGD